MNPSVNHPSMRAADTRADTRAGRGGRELTLPELQAAVARHALLQASPDYVGVSEAGRLLGISADTVRVRYDAGLLAGYRTPTAQRRISRASITAMLASGR